MIQLEYIMLKSFFRRAFYYFFLFLLTIVFIPILLGEINTTAENSRYMISALIQSEAAIVAIVITLTIIAVQQTSSAYSTRLLEIFIYRNPDFLILFFIYISSMIYGFRVLLQIDVEYNPIKLPFLLTISNLYSPIFWTYYFGIFSFFSLILYMYHTINLLKPSEIINILSEKITSNNLYYGNDPIQPIIDIISASLMDKYDNETTIIGLKTIKNKIIHVLCADNFSQTDKLKNIIKSLRYEIDKQKDLPTIENESSLKAFIRYLENDEIENFEKFEFFNSFSHRKSFNCFNLDDSAIKSIMEDMANEYSKINRIFMHFERIGHLATTKLNKEILYEVTKSIEEIGITAINQNLKYIPMCAISSLEKIGTNAIKKEMSDVALNISNSLYEFTYNIDSDEMKKYLFPLVNKSISNIKDEAKNLGLDKLNQDILDAGLFSSISEMADNLE